MTARPVLRCVHARCGGQIVDRKISVGPIPVMRTPCAAPLTSLAHEKKIVQKLSRSASSHWYRTLRPQFMSCLGMDLFILRLVSAIIVLLHNYTCS